MGMNRETRETRKKMHQAPNLELFAQASNLKLLKLLSFAKERLGEVM